MTCDVLVELAVLLQVDERERERERERFLKGRTRLLCDPPASPSAVNLHNILQGHFIKLKNKMLNAGFLCFYF